MRGQNGGRSAPVQNIYMCRNRIYTIRIQHHGHVQIRKQSAHKGLCLRRTAKSRPNQRHIAASGLFQNSFILLRKREGHRLVALDRHNGVNIPRNSQKYQSRSHTHRRTGRKHGRTGKSLAPGQDEHLPKVPLVRGAGTVRQYKPAMLRIDAHRFRHLPDHLMDQIEGDPDVHDMHLSGVRPALIQIQAGLAAAECHRSRGLYRHAQHFPRIRMDAGGNVTGNHRSMGR